MPFLLIPLLAGGTGLLGGFFAGKGVSGISRTIQFGTIAFILYLLIKNKIIKI